MLDPAITGDHGFDTLRFRVTIESTQVVDVNFSDMAAAFNFFDDNELSFGSWTSLISSNEVLDLSFALDITERHLGEGFYTSLIVGASPSAMPVLFAVSRRGQRKIS